jgi:hypothetical protein
MKRLLTAALFIALAATTTLASADPTTVSVVTTPKGADVDIGEPCVVAITLSGSRVGQNVKLPKVDNLELITTGMYYDNFNETFKFYLAPKKEGDYTIPAFTLKVQSGETLQVPAIQVHCPRIHAD